jgi:hypothetical protein
MLMRLHWCTSVFDPRFWMIYDVLAATGHEETDELGHCHCTPCINGGLVQQ